MDIENATKEELAEIKKWFFKENMRLKQEQAAIDKEKEDFEKEKHVFEQEYEMKTLKVQMFRKQLDKEKRLFDLKWKKLEQEVYDLARERDNIAKQRSELQTMNKSGNYELLFVGVNSELSLKRRYRELIKIFHPDNLNGDTSTLQEINKEYDSLKKIFCV